MPVSCAWAFVEKEAVDETEEEDGKANEEEEEEVEGKEEDTAATRCLVGVGLYKGSESVVDDEISRRG